MWSFNEIEDGATGHVFTCFHTAHDFFELAHTVYYLPGHGGQLHTGLGEGLTSRGWNVTGRATVGEFRQMRFDDQVAAVAEDLQAHFWHEGAHVVGNSFGAYLFLHAQAQLAPFPGKVLLLSPIVDGFEYEANNQVFMPPRADHLQTLAQSGRYPAPRRCVIHVGAEDWQSVPAHAQAFGQLTGIPVTVAPGRGHMLGADYVGAVLDGWLGR